MSQAHARPLRGSQAGQGLDALLDGLPGLLSTAANQYVSLLKRSADLVGGLLPADLLDTRANDCCSVPTQDCPPRCIGEIGWQGCGCETQRASITVKNTGTQTRTFSFSAGSLGPAKVDVQPASATLAPCQSATVQVTVPGNQELKAGETYTGELLIRGAYEQCVCLSLRVEPPAVPHLDVSQGEIPERITELKWYRHWQCTDPCATTRSPDDPRVIGAGDLVGQRDPTPGREPVNPPPSIKEG